MKLISHRGNIGGTNPCLENTADYIDVALKEGYDVEIDVRMKNDKLFLGHDEPQYETDLGWLNERKGALWIHCKDFLSLSTLLKTDLSIFYHEREDYTIISNGIIWAHNLENFDNRCIIPLLTHQQVSAYNGQPAYGVCSDFIQPLDQSQ